MNRIKMSLMAVAFFCTAGLSYGTTALEKAAPNDCSPTGFPPGTMDSLIDCLPPPTVYCCTLMDGDFTMIYRRG